MKRLKDKTWHLNIFLIKKDVSEDGCLSNKKGYKKIGLEIGNLYLFSSFPHPPRWLSFFENQLTSKELTADSVTHGAVLFVIASKRLFAIVFGVGRHLLEPGTWESNFGLKVCLNSIRSNRVRSVDKRTLDSLARHTKTQSSKEAEILDFGIDIEQDLLHAVTGSPADKALGSRMTGADTLNVSVKVKLSTLNKVLEKYYIKFSDTFYRAEYPWVGQIEEVRDPTVIERLDSQLIEILSEGSENIWMSVPEIIDWSNVEGFRYEGSQDVIDDIDIRSLLSLESADSKLTIEELKQLKVYCISSDTEQIIKTWRAYSCVYAELRESRNYYVLNNGMWYCVDKKLIQDIDKSINLISKAKLILPPYSDIDEHAYNSRASEVDHSLALMDKKLITHGGGRSKIEFSDLFSLKQEIVHIKRYGGSSVLSHLFAQGNVSGELFRTEREFRVKVNDELPNTHKLSAKEVKELQRMYNVVFGIVTKFPDKFNMPLFSRINLNRTAKHLKGLGYEVSLCLIPIVGHA